MFWYFTRSKIFLLGGEWIWKCWLVCFPLLVWDINHQHFQINFSLFDFVFMTRIEPKVSHILSNNSTSIFSAIFFLFKKWNSFINCPGCPWTQLCSTGWPWTCHLSILSSQVAGISDLLCYLARFILDFRIFFCLWFQQSCLLPLYVLLFQCVQLGSGKILEPITIVVHKVFDPFIMSASSLPHVNQIMWPSGCISCLPLTLYALCFILNWNLLSRFLPIT